ncbi:DUF4298 domain-containing protein [Corynebacterium glucuronolyticum]|uniref:DUF4298 domain-containing protein n=3 Tax=Corynebacteriaceae TaxID=1653 RepID=A0A7T4JU60_9CORY|nr:hypothetical protein HMPREF0294_1752 [Corynebacterium glucuronolyticum ATCC 51867]EEI61987.1 hypothetical protein HMPREF0293_2525 [Corynebacterium glucuronolyticum ATCC 51866]OFO43699.1 hypothetical protein HMPREF3044_02665 [Corynebacterium sp. HMSC073D01]QQB45481.1 DUF4298 domain-containing protein [Corynebacterium glucuronolyticum]WKD63883.1 hypothetical protein CGLUCO_08180 [Corynebacterium glucuronolyticum DSM 44120]
MAPMNEQMKRIELNNERLNEITAFNAKYEDIGDTFAEAWETLKPLIAYYESQWSTDLAETDAAYGVMSEDGVWNEMGTFYEIMKDVAATSQRILAEYEGEDSNEGGE